MGVRLTFGENDMKKSMLLTASFLASVTVMAACSPAANTGGDTVKAAATLAAEAQTNASAAAAPAKLGTFGIDLTAKDESVHPGDDFFQFVNGGWLERTEIPADRSRYGSFNVLADQAEIRVREIIEESASKVNPSVDEKRIGDLFAAYTDVDTIEAKGLEPILADLARVRAVSTLDDAVATMTDPILGVGGPVGGYVWIDAKQNDQYIFHLNQSGLGLPNRDYYFDDSEKGQSLLSAYRDYIATLLTEAGLDNVTLRADAIVAFETALAENYNTRVENRDRDATYNKMDLSEIRALMPGFPIDVAMATQGLDGQSAFIVRQPKAMEGAAKVLSTTDMEVLRDYMTARLIGSNSAILPKRIDDANFEFYGKTLRGQEEQRPRWKRGVSMVNGALGELVGKVYVDRHFPPSSKAQMEDLIENLRDAFKDGIDNLEWMGEQTKVEAQYKLAKFRPKIGYPSAFETYDGLTVDRDDLYGTMKSIRAWNHADEIGRLGGPIDREEWGMTPQTVNAYYNSTLNEIVFPAAILDAPFFDPNADPAVNYGGIGAVIGHEMGHGFDDQGRKSDGDGVQRDWWTAEDAARYEERASKLADQYSAFEPLPGENLNGRLGLGENIGDLTGVTMAYEAYRRSLGGEEAPIIDGLTGDQRFFMAWAQVWAIKWREEALRAQIKNGPHSPGEFRTNGIVRNVDAWYEAFDVGPDHDMYIPPEQRVKIW
jgi:predicted metalloendopeptidase/predicted small secreted protein